MDWGSSAFTSAGWMNVRQLMPKTTDLISERDRARQQGDAASSGKDNLRTVVRSPGNSGAAPLSLETHDAILKALLENNPLAIVVLDSDDRVQMCNPAFEQLFDYQQDALIGRGLDRLIAVEGNEGEAVEISRRVARGEVVRFTSKRRRADGGQIEVEILGVPLLVNGRRVGSFGIYQDISSRTNLEKAQRSAEERLRSLFENAIEGIFQTTPEGRYLSANPALARIFGYDAPAPMMAAVKDIGTQLYADPVRREEFKRLMETTDVVEGFEYELVRRDGKRVWINENAHAVRDEKGKLLYYEGTVEDITARKRAEVERQATMEITHAVNVTENLSDLLRLIHSALKKVLYAENCIVALHDPASGMFQFPFFADQHDSAPPPQKVGRSCTAYVFHSGRAASIPQAVFDKLVASGEVELVGTASPSWLGVPLRSASATIGVLVVQHYTDANAYSERDLEFLESVGGQIALAIERKRSEAALRDSEARLRVLVEQLPAILWTVDANLRFTSALGAGLTRVGVYPEDVVGKDDAGFLRDHRPRISADHGTSPGCGRRGGNIPHGMARRFLCLPCGGTALAEWAAVRGHLHGAGCF